MLQRRGSVYEREVLTLRTETHSACGQPRGTTQAKRLQDRSGWRYAGVISGQFGAQPVTRLTPHYCRGSVIIALAVILQYSLEW